MVFYEPPAPEVAAARRLAALKGAFAQQATAIRLMSASMQDLIEEAQPRATDYARYRLQADINTAVLCLSNLRTEWRLRCSCAAPEATPEERELEAIDLPPVWTPPDTYLSLREYWRERILPDVKALGYNLDMAREWADDTSFFRHSREWPTPYEIIALYRSIVRERVRLTSSAAAASLPVRALYEWLREECPLQILGLTELPREFKAWMDNYMPHDHPSCFNQYLSKLPEEFSVTERQQRLLADVAELARDLAAGLSVITRMFVRSDYQSFNTTVHVLLPFHPPRMGTTLAKTCASQIAWRRLFCANTPSAPLSSAMLPDDCAELIVAAAKQFSDEATTVLKCANMTGYAKLAARFPSMAPNSPLKEQAAAEVGIVRASLEHRIRRMYLDTASRILQKVQRSVAPADAAPENAATAERALGFFGRRPVLALPARTTLIPEPSLEESAFERSRRQAQTKRSNPKITE